jgi:hypothetical protein
MACLNGTQVCYNISTSSLYHLEHRIEPGTASSTTATSQDIMTGPFAVTVHPFTSPTPSSCAYERGDSSSRNALVYLGGLTSGPHATPQIEPLIEALQAGTDLSYSFWEFRMRSSYTGFGFSSLANDAEDLSALVIYLKGLGKEKIVLLGSSTGSLTIYTHNPYSAY